MVFVCVEKFISGDEVLEEDMMVYYMLIEEREYIEKLIVDYDVRLFFDELGSK